ncbi:A-kinase anchor protein 9 isoform X17 [Magallana gigas]|uniref:A-kinase anchor protein 9 isoform X17 n=1 Tax=Magallana gigas TaxID=29159 RepID=UPI00333FD0DA
MEDDERTQKLKAGKQKLAEFQKKRKKKTHLPKDAGEEEPVTVVTHQSEASLSSSGDVSFSDSDQGMTETAPDLCTELYAAYDRIEELEESLTGKQLALDKVISENDQLQRKIQESKLNDLESAVKKREELIVQLSSALQTVTSQTPSDAIATEMAQEVQNLKSQLLNASKMLETQTEKYRTTTQTLQEAKAEISILQKHLRERDKGQEVKGSPATNQEEPSQLQAANEERLQLEQELLEARNQIASLQERLQDNLTGNDEKLGQILGELEALQEVVTGKDHELLDLQSRVSASEEERDKLQSHISDIEEERDRLSNIVSNLEARILENDRLKEENDKLKTNIQDVEERSRKELEQIKNENIEVLENLRNENAKESECLLNERDELKSKLVEFENSIKETTEMKLKMKDLEEKLKEMEEKSATESGELDLLRTDYELLTDTLKLKNERIAELERSVTEEKHEIEIELLRGDNELLSEQVRSLEEKMEGSEKNIAEKGRQLEFVRTEVEELESRLRDKDEIAFMYETRINNLQREKEQQALEMDQLNEELENALLKCKRTDELDLQLESLVSQLNGLQQECQCYRVQNDELKNKINVQQDLYLSQQYQIEVAGREKEELLTENQRLGVEKEELRQEVMKLQVAMENSGIAKSEDLMEGNVESRKKVEKEMNEVEAKIRHLKEENLSWKMKVQSMEDKILDLQKDLEVSQDSTAAEIGKLHDFYKQEILDKDDVINSLQTEIKNYKANTKKENNSTAVGKHEDWKTSENSDGNSITNSMMESMVEDLLCQSEAAIEKEAGYQKEDPIANWEKENVCEEIELVQEEMIPVSHINLLTSCEDQSSKLGKDNGGDQDEPLELCASNIGGDEEEISHLHHSLSAPRDSEVTEEGTIQSSLSENESSRLDNTEEEIRSVLNLESSVSLDSENFLMILKTLENQKHHLLEKLKRTEAERDKLQSKFQNTKTDEISDDSLNLDDSIDEDNTQSQPQFVEDEIIVREETNESFAEGSIVDETEDGVDGPDSLEVIFPDTSSPDNGAVTRILDEEGAPPAHEMETGRQEGVTMAVEPKKTQLEGLKEEYESQLNSLQEELGRQGQGEISEQTIRDMFQQEMESFKESLDSEHQQQLQRIIQGVGETISRTQRQHTQYQEELNLQLQAMRLTLEQIYQGQVEVTTSEQEQRHLADLDRLRETLSAKHAEEMSRLESEWSSRMSELEREHEDELNDSLLEDSLIVQTIEIDYPRGSETTQSSLLHKLNKKLSEEHRQLLKKISDGLDRHEPRLRTPRKHRHTQGQQTESEDGETDSIRSLPVTGNEFLHLDEREKVLHNAQDVQQSLETQREEISLLRSRMLAEYEQLLTTRAEIMSSQTQEVEKLQREMEDLQQSYEDQIKTFQTKVEEQSEEAMQTRLKEEHDREVQDIRDQYQSQISELSSQLEVATQEVMSLKQEVTSIQDQYVTSRQEQEVTSASDDSVEHSVSSASNMDLRSKMEELEKLLAEKSNEVDELYKKLELESQLNIELREKMTLTENRVSETEEQLSGKQTLIEDMKNKLQETENRLKTLEGERKEIEKKREDSSESEENDEDTAEDTSEELNDRLMKLQQELDASQEQERVLEEQYDELQHQHREQIEALRQDLEHEHRAEIMEVQSEFKVQLEIELKRQAADLAYDYGEKIKKMEEDHEQEVEEIQRKMEKSVKELEKLQQDAVDGAVSIPESPTKNYPESPDLLADDEPDSLSKSTETASTVIDASRHDRLLKKSSEDSGDKTDSELEEMDSETHDEGGKPVSMEEFTRGDPIKESDDFEDVSESSSTETSETSQTSQSVAAVSQLMGKINIAKQETFMKLKQEYEAKIDKLTEDLEQAMLLNDDREKCIDEITERYEEKINEMRVHYEMRIKSLEESDIDVEEIKEKVKLEFVKNYEAELARVHIEYEEKMDLVKQEMAENFDSEKQEMEKRRKSELEAAEEKYDTLMDRIRGGEAPEVADLVRDRIDTELEMAKSLMQQEFEETIESEQARFADLQEEFERKLLEEKEKEMEELHTQHEAEIAKNRENLTEEFQAKLEAMEDKYSKEIEKLQDSVESGMQQTLATEYEIQEYQDKIRDLETELERLVRDSESGDEKSSKRSVDESGVMVSASSEFDTDGETKDSGKGTSKVEDPTESKLESEECENLVNMATQDLRDSGGEMISRDESQKEELVRRDSTADLDNSIKNLKGSHAAAIAEIEEEYNAKLAGLRADLERDYQAKLDKLKQELSSTTSSLNEANEGQGQTTRTDDLDIAHIEELRDLEVRLTEKHSQDLCDLEDRYKVRIQEIQDHHQEEMNNLKKVLEYLQQTPDDESSKSQVNITPVNIPQDPGAMSSPGPKRSTPVRDMEDSSNHGDQETPPQEVSVDLIKFESSIEEGGTPLRPPTEKPPAIPRDAGTDLLSDEVEESVEQTQAPSTDAPPGEGTPGKPDSGRSTPSDLLQTMSADLLTQGLQMGKSLGSSTEFSTSEAPTETVSLATELRDKEDKICELEKEIESLQSKFAEIVERRERENEESRNLEVMLKSDLERVHSERESIQSTNEHLLQLLSDAVKTYLNVEDTINRKLSSIVTGGQPGEQPSPLLHRRSPPPGKPRSPPGSHPRSPPTGQRPMPPEPSSPGGAEGGDVPPHETSLLSNLTDEGLDLSQRTITESIFQGPDLDTEGEELLTDASNRLQGSVSRLLDMIEDTTHQLYDSKRTQHDLVTSVSSGQQESLSVSTRCEELEERLREEVEAKEYLAMELHKAEGLIEGYSTERDQREQQVRDLEEKTEALVLELETTKNKLLDLETSHHEATSLRSEMQRQRELLNDNVGDQAQVTMGAVTAPSSDQALMLELNKLNDEKRSLQLQLRTTTEKYEKRVAELENAGEETERHYVELLEKKKLVVEDLQLQLDSVEKQLKSNRQFIESMNLTSDEQANEREQERDEFVREVEKLKKSLSDQEKKQAAENRLQREVENLTEELQDRIDSHSEIVQQTQRLKRDLSDKQMTSEELAAVVRQLEQEVEEQAKTEQAHKLKIRQLEQMLERRRSVSEMSDKMAAEQEEEECESASESESTGSETRAMRRRRKLPSHISLQQEEALYQEKEQLQLQLEDQLKQISALRNQLDEMRHRGDYSGGFLDDSQTSSLQRQVDNQREVTEEKDKEIAELKEQLNDLKESLSNKEKLISQLTNQIQASNQANQSEAPKEDKAADLRIENEDLKRRLRSLEKHLDGTPMSVLSQNLLEEKNQEIDHLTQQLDRLRFEIAALKSGDALAEMQTEVDKLRSDLERKEMELVRASQASTFSDLSDTDGIPAASVSFTEKTNLQQELEDSVAQKMEEFEQLKSALQQKEEEIVGQQQSIQEKEEVIAGLNMTLDEKVTELEKVSKELTAEREKTQQVTSPMSEDTYLNEILQEKETLIEQMNGQIEGLTAEVESLSDFQYKLQEDFDTVQQMLEEKEREIDTLSKELGERTPEDHSEELLKLEMEISKLKKDLKEKDNVIEEKEEEMYLLNEKLEQQQETQTDPQGLAQTLAEKEAEINSLREDKVQLQSALEEKSQVTEEIQAELARVKEQLTAGGDIQTKPDQTGSMNFDLLLKEKETELEKVKTEFANFRESLQDSQKEEVSELKVKVTSLEDELDDLRKEVKDKHEEITQLRSDGETKEMTIQDLQAEIETYQQKQEEQFQKLQSLEEQLGEVRRQSEDTEDYQEQLSETREQLEQVTQDRELVLIRLSEAEGNLGVLNSQLLNKENELQALQAEILEKTVKWTEEMQQAKSKGKEKEEEIHKLQSTRPKSEAKQELDQLLSEKDLELQDVKQRLREAVDLSEQQLRIVEQKDEEFVKLKLEIQQMIAEKDKTIRELKKQLMSQSSSSELEISQLQQEVESKRDTVEELETELTRLKRIQDSTAEAGGDAMTLITRLRDQLRERDEAIKEIHHNLQQSQDELQSKSQELQTKTQELYEAHSKLDQVSPSKNLSREAEQQFRQLQQELQTAKEALAEMQRQAGGASRGSSVERLEYREGSSESDLDLEMMDTDELRRLVLDLKHDLELSKSEVDLFRKSASMSAKDFVQKVMELREELGSQHQRHIQDLTDRNRIESDSNLAQLRIKYEDEIEHIKKLHQKELAQMIGETKRELEKHHKTEINSMLARHKHEIEMLRIREPVMESHDASVLNLANQLGTEVALTERLDSELIRSLSQRPDGQDNADASDIAESEISVDDNVPSRLQVLMKRLHREGVEMLSLSELQFLNRHMPPSTLSREVDLRSLQAAWDSEKQSLLSAVQSLKDLLAQTHRVRGVDKESWANFCDFPNTSDVSDWRGELLRSIGFVFAKERETLLAELRSHVLSHPNVDLTEIQKLEQKIRNQEAHQKASLDQIFSADRQSLLAEVRDLRAHANVSGLRHQEEKERLTEQLNCVEDQTSKRERQLKRQVQLLEYKLQQEKIIQDDLRTSLEVERDRSTDLSNQLSREKNAGLDLQTDLSNQQLQISKLKDALEREQSRFISVTTIWNDLVGALEEEKTKCQHLSELLERERAALRQIRSKVDEMKLESDSKDRHEFLLERLTSDLNTERDRRLQAENAQELEKVALANLQQELDLERKNLRSTESEYKARIKQLSTAVELERAKSNDLQGALERERVVNDKLRENLDSERRSLLESTDRENSIFEDMQLELESERAKVKDLKNSVEREKQRLQSQVTALESQTSVLKDELEQERLACRQMKNEIDQIQLQKLDITRHYEHERDQVSRLKSERELLRSEVKSLKDVMNEKERNRDTEKVTERRSQRQLERERDDQKMKMHENELEIQRLTQRVLDLEDQVSDTREREMEATRELQQEKLRSTHQRVDSEGSEEDPDHWNIYKTQLESICQSLQYLILQYQDQLSSGVKGSVNVQSLEKSLKDLLSELKQTQTPLALESDTMDSLTSRPSAQAVNQRVLHHNSELTNFVSRLTEEKMELRNTLGRLEEEIWRYRQRGAEQQNGHDMSENHTDQENRHLEARASWAKERLSLQLALNQMEQELDQCRADLRVERDRRSGIAGVGTEGDRDRIQRLYGKYLRADSYRKALVYQKKYLLLLLGGFQDCEQTTLALIARMGVYPSPEDLQRGTRPRRPVTAFRSAARVVVAVTRMRYLVRKWKRATRVGSPVMGGTVDLQQGYAPNSNSFSPPRINTQSRVNGSGPFNSHASSPLHSSVHQSPYSPSYLSSSFTQRDLLNGASPYHSLGGASSGYHVNSNGVTNGISPYQSVGGISDSYHVNSNFSVHTTPPTRDYSSKPHPTSENSGARRKILSSSSPNPTKVGHSSPARRVRISEPSSHDDYISRLENLQQRLSGMDSGTPRSRLFPRR